MENCVFGYYTLLLECFEYQKIQQCFKMYTILQEPTELINEC